MKYEAGAALRRAVKQTIEAISGPLGFRPNEVTVEDGDAPVPNIAKAHAAVFPDGDNNLAEHYLYRHDAFNFKIVVLVVGAVAQRQKMAVTFSDDPDTGLAQRCQKIITAVGEYPGNIAVMLLANTLMDVETEGKFIVAPMYKGRQAHPSTWNSEHSFFGRENFGAAYKKEPGVLVSDPATGRRDVLSFKGAQRIRSFLP